MKTRHYSSLAMLLLALFVFLNSGAGIQAQTLVQSPPKEPTACAAFTAVQQQEFDTLTASKDAGTLTEADMARYDALAQQLNCYNAQFAAAAQPEQTRGALPAAPLAAGVCDTAGPIEVEGTLTGTTPTAYALSAMRLRPSTPARTPATSALTFVATPTKERLRRP